MDSNFILYPYFLSVCSCVYMSSVDMWGAIILFYWIFCWCYDGVMQGYHNIQPWLSRERVSNPALSWSSQCVLGCHVSSSSHTQWNIDPFYSTHLHSHPLPVPLSELQDKSGRLRMGFPATGTMMMLVLSLGMLEKDVTTAVGLPGKGKPDFDGVEKLLKNISSSQHSGETKMCGESGS